MKQNTIYIIIASLVVAAGAYWFFFTDTGNEPPLVVSDDTNQAQAEFETLLRDLPITFDTSLFANPNFKGLVDITTTIAPEVIGRPDPFAPIAGTSKTPATTR
jgi:hypothetical protein